MKAGLATGLLLLLSGSALHAQEQQRPAPPPKPPAAKPPPPPLSPEDAEVARDLALLEKLEMLKTLDLFEPDPPPAKP